MNYDNILPRRIVHKNDTTENWEKAKNFVPLEGELIIYKDKNENAKIKIGDGETLVNDLPFIDEKTLSLTNTIEGKDEPIIIDDASPLGTEIEIQVQTETEQILIDDYGYVHYTDYGVEPTIGIESITTTIVEKLSDYEYKLDNGCACQFSFEVSLEIGTTLYITNFDWENMYDSQGVEGVKVYRIIPKQHEKDKSFSGEGYYTNNYASYEKIVSIYFPDNIDEDPYLYFESGRTFYLDRFTNEELEQVKQTLKVGDVVYITNNDFDGAFDGSGSEGSDIYTTKPIDLTTPFDIYDKDRNDAIICDNVTDSNGYLKTTINYPPESIGIAQMGESITYDFLECDIENRVRYTVKTCSIQDEIITCTFNEGGYYSGYTNRTELVPAGTAVWMDNNNLYKLENLKDFTVTYTRNTNKVLGLEPSDKNNCLVQFKDVPKVDSYLNEKSTNAIQNKAITKELNKKASKEEVTQVAGGLQQINQKAEELIPQAEEALNNLEDRKMEGISINYTMREKGWHRILNVFRGVEGTLNAVLSDGFCSHSITFDVSNFLMWHSAPEQIPNFFQTNYTYLRPNPMQGDDNLLYGITKVRFGYPSQEDLYKYDATYTTPLIGYVDIFVDYNYLPDSNYSFICQFNGKTHMHNLYKISKETTDSNYTVMVDSLLPGCAIGTSITLDKGMYGEKLDFYTVPVRRGINEYASNKKVLNKELYAENFYLKNKKPVENDLKSFHNLGIDPIDIYFTQGAQNIKVELLRKYNILNLYTDAAYTGSSTDVFCLSQGAGSNRKIVPYKVQRKKMYGLNYNFTNAGTLIFTGTTTNTSENQTFNIFYSGTNVKNAVYLPKGRYLTNMFDIYYCPTDVTFKAEYTRKVLSNKITSTGVSQSFIDIEKDVYLAFARMAIDNDFNTTNIVPVIPFLIKVPDDCNDTSCITYSSNILAAAAKSIDDEGNLVLEDKNDKIIITDRLEDKEVEINWWTDFYTSERLVQTVPVIPAGYSEKVVNTDSNSMLVDMYNMYNSSFNGNDYDTILIDNGNGIVRTYEYLSTEKYVDNSIKEVSNQYANAIKETLNGSTTLEIKDASPLEHNIKVTVFNKNIEYTKANEVSNAADIGGDWNSYAWEYGFLTVSQIDPSGILYFSDGGYWNFQGQNPDLVNEFVVGEIVYIGDGVNSDTVTLYKTTSIVNITPASNTIVDVTTGNITTSYITNDNGEIKKAKISNNAILYSEPDYKKGEFFLSYAFCRGANMLSGKGFYTVATCNGDALIEFTDGSYWEVDPQEWEENSEANYEYFTQLTPGTLLYWGGSFESNLFKAAIETEKIINVEYNVDTKTYIQNLISTVYIGEAAPTNDIGKDGDIYVEGSEV